jgi:PST family polysaccharide transporter
MRLDIRKLLRTARHPMTQNAVAMYGVQFVITVLPLLTLPWLARVLGPSELGRVFFAQSFAVLLGILVGYGFLLSGSRDIARQRGDRWEMERTVAGVLGAQVILIAIATGASLVALVGVAEFRADPRLVAFAWFMGTVQGLNPAWFLLGLEQARPVAYTEVTVRSVSALAILLFVRDADDGLLVLWIWSAGNALVTLRLMALMYRLVLPRRPTISHGWQVLRAGWALFVGSASSTFYSYGTVFMLGLVVSTAQLALYASAQRLVAAAVRVTAPIGAVTYPRVTYLVGSGREDRAQRLASLTLIATGVLAGAIAIGFVVLAPQLVDVLVGPEFSAATPILRGLAVLLPLLAVAATLSGQWLLPRGLDRAATSITLVGGISSVLLTLVVGSLGGTLAVVWTLVAVQATVVVSLAFVIWREGLLPRRAHLLGS